MTLPMRAALVLLGALAHEPAVLAEERVLSVMASAYNSVAAQTDRLPNQGAWGDRIEPGMKVVAVSRDLLRAGLKRGTKIRIDGLEGEWTVLDRTPSRWRNTIDIYMGTDVKAAREWGRRRVTIRWTEGASESARAEKGTNGNAADRAPRLRAMFRLREC